MKAYKLKHLIGRFVAYRFVTVTAKGDVHINPCETHDLQALASALHLAATEPLLQRTFTLEDTTIVIKAEA